MYEVPRGIKFIETENRIAVARGWREEGMGNYCLMDRISVEEDEKVLELDGGNGCTTV